MKFMGHNTDFRLCNDKPKYKGPWLSRLEVEERKEVKGREGMGRGGGREGRQALLGVSTSPVGYSPAYWPGARCGSAQSY